nr:hypothetical protein [Tanacetum cinerariifolium]
MICRFQHNPGELHQTTVKNILKYLHNTKDMFLVYGGDTKREFKVSCYTDVGYLTDVDELKSQTGHVFVLNGGVVDWESTKQSIFATSSTNAKTINMYCDNTGAITIAKNHRVTKGARHFCAKVHYLCETIEMGDARIEKVNTDDNLADPFMKALAFPKHSELTKKIRMIPASSLMITRDQGSFGEETDKNTDLYQHFSRLCSQQLKTASQFLRDAVTTHPTTASHIPRRRQRSLLSPLSRIFSFMMASRLKRDAVTTTIKRLTKPFDEPERELRRLRKAVMSSHQNESLAIAKRNLFDDEASSSNNTGAKLPTPPKTLYEHSRPNSSSFQNPITFPTEQTGRIIDSRDIWLIQSTCTFKGSRNEDPLCHVKHYLSIVDNIQGDRATRDASRKLDQFTQFCFSSLTEEE